MKLALKALGVGFGILFGLVAYRIAYLLFVERVQPFATPATALAAAEHVLYFFFSIPSAFFLWDLKRAGRVFAAIPLGVSVGLNLFPELSLERGVLPALVLIILYLPITTRTLR